MTDVIQPLLAPLPEFDDFFTKESIARQVRHLHKFQFWIRYIPNGAIGQDSAADRAFSVGTDAIREILLEAGVHRLHLLNVDCPAAGENVPRDKPRFCWRLQDDMYNFQVHVAENGFYVTKSSCSFENFYDWYARFMPFASGLESTIRRAAEEDAGRSIHISQVTTTFEFCFTDFHHAKDKDGETPRRNVEVLQDLIPALPSEEGINAPLSAQSFSRLDLKQGRVESFGPDGTEPFRSCWYNLEAPSNERGRFLSFTAEIQNHSIDSTSKLPGGERSVLALQPDTRDEYLLAMARFLRDRALEGFVESLFRNWRFSSCLSM